MSGLNRAHGPFWKLGSQKLLRHMGQGIFVIKVQVDLAVAVTQMVGMGGPRSDSS